MQLLGMVSKQVEEMRKEGEAGRRKLEQYTRYGTIVLSRFQSFGVALYARRAERRRHGRRALRRRGRAIRAGAFA